MKKYLSNKKSCQTAMLYSKLKDKYVQYWSTQDNPQRFEHLQAWAVAKGLPACPIGLSTVDYYRVLCRQVEKSGCV